MQQRNLRDIWMFWREAEMDDLRPLFSSWRVIDRNHFATTADFYRAVIRNLILQSGVWGNEPDCLYDFVETTHVYMLARSFLCMLNFLPKSYVVGVDDTLRRFIIAQPKRGKWDAIPKGPVRGKWVLLDREAKLSHKWTDADKIMVRFDPDYEYPTCGEQFYRDAINRLMHHGTIVNLNAQLSHPDDVWTFFPANLLPGMFMEAVNNLPKHLKVAVTPDLLWFCIVEQ